MWLHQRKCWKRISHVTSVGHSNDGRPAPARQYPLHWDGLSTSLRETAISGAIGDGMNYQSFADAEPTLNVIIDFIRLQKPPPSPFSAAREAGDPYHVE